MELEIKDIYKIMATLRQEFPNGFDFNSADEAESRAKTWLEVLKPYSKELVFKAVYEVISESEFPPKVASIANKCRVWTADIKLPIEMWNELTHVLWNVADLWGYIRDGYGTPDTRSARWDKLDNIFTGLDPATQAYLGGMSGLCKLSEMSDTQLSYEKGRFLKVVPDIQAKTKEREQAREFMKLVGSKNLLKHIGGDKNNG